MSNSNVLFPQELSDHVYECTLEEALTTDYKGEKDKNEEARTNIAMSAWIHKIFADMRDTYNLSLAQTMARTIRLGTSLMQRDYNDQFSNLTRGWAKIRWSQNVWVSKLDSITFSMFEEKRANKVYLRYPAWCAQTLGAIAYITRIQKGDLIQLAVYHAVTHSTDILSERQHIHAQSVIDRFGVRLLDTSEFIYTLATKFGKQGE